MPGAELHKDIVTLGMVQTSSSKAAWWRSITFSTPACPLKGMMELEAKEAVKRVAGVTEVKIKMTAAVRKDPRFENVLAPGIKNIIAVGSGKGGVCKSTVACNLAVSLAAEGATVGLMDADICGPNQPQMMGVADWQPRAGADNKLTPPIGYGVKVMSMGFLMDPDAPVIWRGPMLHGAINQFLKDVVWGELTISSSICLRARRRPVDSCRPCLVGAVIVTTPQSIALSDVRKAAAMFDKLKCPCRSDREHGRVHPPALPQAERNLLAWRRQDAG